MAQPSQSLGGVTLLLASQLLQLLHMALFLLPAVPEVPASVVVVWVTGSTAPTVTRMDTWSSFVQEEGCLSRYLCTLGSARLEEPRDGNGSLFPRGAYGGGKSCCTHGLLLGKTCDPSGTVRTEPFSPQKKRTEPFNRHIPMPRRDPQVSCRIWASWAS